MKGLYKDIYITIKSNLKSIFLFEVVYRIVFIVLYSQLIIELMDRLLHMSGYSYLTLKNLKEFFSIPLTYPILFLIVFFAILFSVFEMSVLYSGLRAAVSGQSISIAQMLYRGIKRMGHMLRLRYFPIFVVQGVVFYLFEGFVLYKLIGSSKQASDIRNSVADIRLLLIFLLLIIVVTSVFVIMNLFSTCYVMFGNNDSKNVFEHGRHFWKGRVARLISVFFAGTSFYLIVYYLVYSVLMVITAFLVVVFAKANLEMALIEVISDYIETILLFFLSIMSIIIYSGITVGAFYYFEPERKEKINESVRHVSKGWSKRTLIIILLVILGGTIYNIVDVVRNGNLAVENTFGGINITSHRGFSAKAPENTIPSLELAIESLADYSEIDIRQTKDRQIIVMHDSSVYRTTGVSKNVSDMTYNEIYSLDAGSKFSRNYAGTHVPTLREALELCKGRINMNIEVKKSSKDVGFIKDIYELVEKMDMEEQCVFSSTSYDYLKQLKECSDKLVTGYIVPAAYGNYFDDDNIDFFSVNSAFLTMRNVDKAHSYGKGIHAWTVNTQTELNRMKMIGVDSIITDRPIYAREVLHGEKATRSLMSYIKLLIN